MKITSSTARLSLRALACSVPQEQGERILFDDVNLQLYAGDLALLTGPSGVGKSSLLRCLIGLDPACRGQVLVDGQAFNAQNAMQLRAEMIYIAQRPALDSLSLEEYLEAPLAFGQHKQRSIEAEQRKNILQRLSLHDLDLQQVQERLSGGEQKRLAFARALLLQPKILLLDEPSAGLDADRVDDLLELIKEFVVNGGAALLVSHDLSTQRLGANRLLQLGPTGLVERKIIHDSQASAEHADAG